MTPIEQNAESWWQVGQEETSTRLRNACDAIVGASFLEASTHVNQRHSIGPRTLYLKFYVSTMSTEEPSSGSSTEKPTNGSQHSLLYAKLEDLSIPHHLAEPISSAAERTHKRLTIVLQPRVLDTTGNSDLSYTKSWNELQSLLTFVYVQATKISQSLDRVLMDINVLFLAAHQTLADEIGDGVDTLYLIGKPQGSLIIRQLLTS